MKKLFTILLSAGFALSVVAAPIVINIGGKTISISPPSDLPVLYNIPTNAIITVTIPGVTNYQINYYYLYTNIVNSVLTNIEIINSTNLAGYLIVVDSTGVRRSTVNGSSLTNVNAAKLGAVVASSYINAFTTLWMTNPFLEWWSADMIPPTNNMSLITSWTGRNGNTVTGNVWYVTQAPSGHPAVYYDGTGNNWLTNTTVLGGFSEPGYCTNQCTIFCVFGQSYSTVSSLTPSSGWNVLFDGMVANGSERGAFSTAFPFRDSVSYPIDFFGNYPGLSSIDYNDRMVWQNGDNVKIYCITWATNSLETFLNGKISQNYPYGPYYATFPPKWPVGFAGTLSFGQLANSGFACHDYMYEFLVFTNQLSNQVIDQINHYFMDKYGLIGGEIDQFGDSMLANGSSTFPEGWNYWLATNFPSFHINNQAIPGATSAQTLSNVVVAASTSCVGKPKVAIIWCNGENGGESVATITNNLKTIANVLATNGWLSIIVSPPSNGYTDTNQFGIFKIAYDTMVTNCLYPNFFSGLINLSADPLVGYSNAWTNTIYYPLGGYIAPGGGAHWTNAAYSETAPTAIGAVQSVLNPAQATTIPVSGVKGIGGITNAYVYGAVTGTNTFSYSVPSGVTNSYAVYGKLTVTALSVDVAQPQLVWTDETGAVRTFSITSAISATGYSNIPYTTILAKGGTTIFLTNSLTTATGSLIYNIEGHLTGISSTQ
jgi:hypothetical protein